MSTKKKDTTPVQMTERDGITMILEKKSGKKNAPDNIQAKLEAGKAEIMKVVEGVPGSEKLAELIERGKKKGSLSSSELMDVLEDMDLESDQMDKIPWRTWASTRWARTTSPTCPTTRTLPWRPWRTSARRRSWTPTPWWTPSAPTTRCACT